MNDQKVALIVPMDFRSKIDFCPTHSADRGALTHEDNHRVAHGHRIGQSFQPLRDVFAPALGH